MKPNPIKNPPRSAKDDARFLAAIERLMKRDGLVAVGAAPFQWFVMIASVQLASRHPDFPASNRKIVEAMVAHLSNLIAFDDPDLRELIERGWHDEAEN